MLLPAREESSQNGGTPSESSVLRRWRASDFASVNVSEDGCAEVMRALLDAGIGIEAGV
jgi:hypothetical protein